MPLRQIGDGHASPLDMEFIKQNFVRRLKDAQGGMSDLQRDINVKPEANALTHKMLYQDVLPESPKAYADMNSLDVMRLVSSHDHALIAGMPAVEYDTLYFEVGSVEDKETLDAGSSAYGMRSGEELEVEATVRYEGAAGTISMTHIDPASSATKVIEDTAANLDAFPIGQYRNYTYRKAQGFKPDATWLFENCSIKLKRHASTTFALLHIEIYGDDGTGKPKYLPDDLRGEALLELDDTLTTDAAGEWVTVPFTIMPRCAATRQYHVVIYATDVVSNWDTGIHLIYTMVGSYADGQIHYCASNTNVWYADNAAYDILLKFSVLTAETTNLVVNAAYAGWQEASADVTLRLAHDFYEKMNFADFFLTVPEDMAVNALCLRDKASGGEAHWRCDHVRTRHIFSPDAQAAAGGAAVLDYDCVGNTNTYTTTSVPYVDLTGMSVSVTVLQDALIVLLFSGTYRGTSAGRDIFARLHTGANVAIGSRACHSATAVNDSSPVALNHCVAVAAGTHTYKVRWHVSSGMGAFSSQSLCAVAFSR